MVWPGPRDDPAADVIGDEDEGSWLAVRWPWLSGRWLSGRGRVTGVLVAVAVAVTAAVTIPGLHPASPARGAPRPSRDGQPAVAISSAMVASVPAGGTFAFGTVAGRPWRMAVQNIAGAGPRCQPAVTLNGMDADPLYPGPPRATPVGDPAFMAPGASMPGAGFAFIKVPPDITVVRLEPAARGGSVRDMRPVTVASCGERFRVVGFAYPLAATLRIRASSRTASRSYVAPAAYSDRRPSLAHPQVDGVWKDTDTADARVTTAILATGQAFAQRWAMRVMLGTGGDCFTLTSTYIDDSVNAKPEKASLCGPVSTPRGPDTIVALGLGSPAGGGLGVGYAVSVGPGTVRLMAHLSNGTAMPVTPVTVEGRRYAAFFVPGPARLARLSWADAAHQETTDVQALPEYGYAQFQ